jgi:hypothetical protein
LDPGNCFALLRCGRRGSGPGFFPLLLEGLMVVDLSLGLCVVGDPIAEHRVRAVGIRLEGTSPSELSAKAVASLGRTGRPGLCRWGFPSRDFALDLEEMR